MPKLDCVNIVIHILLWKGQIGIDGNNNMTQKGVVFKNNAAFKSCIWKINNTIINKAKDLDIAIPMYNLLEYGDNYSMILGSLLNYYRHEEDNVKGNASDNKLFKYKTKITGKTEARPTQGQNDRDGEWPTQDAVPNLNV